MNNRKQVFKFIAERYGLGYAEVNNLDCVFITSSYLPNNLPASSIKNLPPALISDYDPLYSDILGLKWSFFGDSYPVHLGFSTNGPEFTAQMFVEILNNMDKRFKPLEIKSEEDSPKKKTEIIFNQAQVGLKNPIVTNKVLFAFFTKKPIDESQYSFVLNFKDSQHLHRFLNGIPEEIKKKAASKIFATYECNYGPGCYQILIPKGSEYQAIELLFRKNIYLSDFPIIHYLVKILQPKGKFASLFQKTITDQELTAAVAVIQQVITHKPMALKLSDFSEIIQRTILNNKELHKAYLATAKHYSQAADVLDFMPTVLRDLVLSYR